MGVEPQETRGIPRNRKCGNCRFYEPAPLWRKGWCRNPKLYPPHANHLVDANTIDCEGGFRSRIYWEPLAGGQVAPPAQPEARPVASSNVTPISPIAANIGPVSSATTSNVGPVSSKTPPSAIPGGPVAQPISPSTEPFQRPSDQPTVSVYKHPLADRSFAPKSSDDSIRPINTNPAPIISRQTFPVQNQSQESPPNNRPPLTPSGGGEPPDNIYQPYNPRNNRNFSAQEPVNREPSNRNFSAQEPPSRNFTPQESTKPFITPPPQGQGSSQAYGDPEDYGDIETFNEPAPGYQEQPTRPYQNQPPQPEAWTEQEPAPPPRKYNDSQPSNFPPPANNNYAQPPNSNYSTQPSNYSSQFGAEKEPIRIQEALPVNTRPRPIEPKKQPQPTPARFRPVKEDQPAANMPVTRDWKAILREKAPFTRNWNLEGITMNRQTLLPWAIGGVLVLILVVVLVANLGKPNTQPNPTETVSAIGATTVAGTTSGNQTTGQATTSASKTTAAGTTVASTTAAVVVKTAVVKGTGGDGLNVRETASLTGTKITNVKEGDKVIIKDGPKDADGKSWYQIDYNGKVGWAVKDFLEIQS